MIKSRAITGKLALYSILTTGAAISLHTAIGLPLAAAMSTSNIMEVDPEYPGTAVARLKSVHARVGNLSSSPGALSGDWGTEVRPKLLWAGGLRDISSAQPGYGYTGHSFNDWNHCDLTTMTDGQANNLNDGADGRQRVEGIAVNNNLGPGIRIASIPELGPGGSWSTCMMGCDVDPPSDVAHMQFRSRIAFKLVWVPPKFTDFVLVDDDGNLLARGSPTGRLPSFQQRQRNYMAVGASKYSVAANAVAKEMQTQHPSESTDMKVEM